MKSYPSISKTVQNIPVYAFDKLDGSNIRAEWTIKSGFCKFGSRHELIDSTHPFLGEAPKIIQNKYVEKLNSIFRKENYEKTVCYFEYFGVSSFAGTHKLDEPHDVVLFDVEVFKKGIINPKQFIKLFGDLHIPKLIYHGNANSELNEQIRNGLNKEVTFEGVVCKSMETDKYGHNIMFKIKSKAWLDKLKNYCKGDEKLFEKLS